MGVGKSGGALKYRAAEQAVSAEGGGSEFCVALEAGVFECGNTIECASIKSGGAIEYSVSETGLALEYGTVEDDIGLEFGSDTIGLRPWPGKDDVLLKGALVKDYGLREDQTVTALAFCACEFLGLEFFGGVKEAIDVEHAGYGALVEVDIVSVGKGLKQVTCRYVLFFTLKSHSVKTKVK